MAGATAKSCVAPLERCKILFQTGRLHSGGVTTTLAAITRTEGARGLFRGNGASVLRIVPYSAVHFGLYEEYRRVLVGAVYVGAAHHTVSPGVDLMAGAGAGATAVLATYPRHTIRGVLSSTLEREGLRGMYHGIGPSMYGILPYAGLKFYVYQSLKQLYFGARGVDTAQPGPGAGPAAAAGGPRGGKPRLPVPVMLGFGAVAGLVAQTATYPLDVVRRRMQVEGLRLHGGAGVSLPPAHFPHDRLPQSTPAALAAIARAQGWRALYAGLGINYMKVVPSTAIGFTIYDYLKHALDLPTNL